MERGEIRPGDVIVIAERDDRLPIMCSMGQRKRLIEVERRGPCLVLAVQNDEIATIMWRTLADTIHVSRLIRRRVELPWAWGRNRHE
jgi:hypothetical protein